MDSRSWPWRRKSSEKVTGLAGSSESSPAHSARYSDDQDSSKASTDHLQMSEEAIMAWHQSEQKLKSLNEKLSQALLDNTAKDNLVKQHAKVAEEAVSGWEKAETEAMTLKQQFDTVTQQKLALEDRVSHLDGALKECMRELRHVREEQEHKIHEAVVEKTREWEKTKFEFDARIVELEQLLHEAKAKNNTASISLQESSKALSDVHEARNRAETEAKALQTKLGTLGSDNTSLKYKLHALSKEVDMIIDERDISKKSAQAAHKQHLETVKKVTKLESECQRLRGLVKKRLPGPGALAQMKLEVEPVGKESGEIKLRRPLSKGARSPCSSVESSNDKHQENSQKEIEHLAERLMAMEEESKMLKDTLSKRNSELKASRVMCARTAAKLSNLEQQFESSMQRKEKPALVLHLEGSKSGSTSNPPSLASISEDGNDGDPESWASALIAELDQFKKEKVTGKIEKLSDLPKIDLMDDFLEMERLASIPSTRLDQIGIGKLDDFTEKNSAGSFGASSVQEDKAFLEEALAQKELKLQAVNQECSDLLKKLTSVQENLTALQAKNTWNESALVSLQEKLDIILEAEAEGADLHRVLYDIKSAMAVATESAADSQVCIRPCVKPESASLPDSGSRISTVDVEFATAVASVVNILQCIAQEPGKTQKLSASHIDKLDVRIQDFTQLVDRFLNCKANIIELIVELISLLSQFRKMFNHDSSEIMQNEDTDLDNQTSEMIQSSFLHNLISKDSLSRLESAPSLSGEENTDSLRFPPAAGNFYIIRKLNSIQVEKTSLESELKAQVSRCRDLEEDLTHFKTENANLETILIATKEKLEHTKYQLTELKEELMRFKSENANLEILLAATKQKLEHTQYQLTESREELMHLNSDNANLETVLAATNEKLEHTQYQLTTSRDELMRFKSENANLERVLAATKEKLEHKQNQLTESREELMSFKNENANLETVLAATKEKLEHTQNQLTESREELMHFKSDNANLEIVLAATKEKLEDTQNQMTESREELMRFKSENANVETVLAATKEKLEHTQNQLTESEQILANLHVQLASAKESKQLSENELVVMASNKSDIESQLKATEIEMKKLSEKVDALESELQEEHMQHKDTMTKYKVLHEQLQRKEQGSEYIKYSVSEEEIKKRQEREIAAAAVKLAECQETILVLSRQLKALALPVDPVEFPCETEKRTERDQGFELDAPWSPHSQAASWTSEGENLSSSTGREINGQWTNESVRYKGNTLDTLTPSDYMDSQFTMLSSSDTEESSPARSPVKTCTHRNRSPFSEGNDSSKSVKVTEGESPTSFSSSSTLTSTFLSKAQE